MDKKVMKQSIFEQLKMYAEANMIYAKFITARDGFVCDLCSGREGKIYTTKEAREQLKGKFCKTPDSNNGCRCSVIGVGEREGLIKRALQQTDMYEIFKENLFSEEEFLKEKASLKFSLSNNDIVWGMLNKKIYDYMKRGYWFRMSEIYFKQALFLNKENKSFFHLLQESRKCGLMSDKKNGVQKVQISTNSCCEECSQFENKVLDIDDALKTLPIPIKECKNDVFNNGRGFCICEYSWSSTSTTDYSNGNVKVNIHITAFEKDKRPGIAPAKKQQGIGFFGLIVIAIIVFWVMYKMYSSNFHY